MSGMSGVRAVVFDLDNTLIDRDAAIAAWLAGAVPAAAVAPCIDLDAGGYGDRAVFFSAVAAAAARPEAEIRAAFRAEMPTHIRPMAGAVDLLARVAARGMRVALATNGDGAMQRIKLRAAGFAVSFDPLLISGEIGMAKPTPGFFRHLLDGLGCAPAEVLMVGDHPRNDIAGAVAAGMRTCWLRTRHHPAPDLCDQRVDHLDEVMP